MKKLLIIAFLFISFYSFGQFNIQTGIGNAFTETYDNGARGTLTGLHFRYSFADTAAANVGSTAGVLIKNIPNFLIVVGDDLHIRNSAATKWLKAGATASINLGNSNLTNSATVLRSFDNNYKSIEFINTALFKVSRVMSNYGFIYDLNKTLDLNNYDSLFTTGIISESGGASGLGKTELYFQDRNNLDTLSKLSVGMDLTLTTARYLKVVGLTNNTTQDRVIGQTAADGNFNWLSLGTGGSISSGVLNFTGTGVLTATNGLTVASNNVKIGGTLVNDTYTAGASFDYIWEGYDKIRWKTTPSFIPRRYEIVNSDGTDSAYFHVAGRTTGSPLKQTVIGLTQNTGGGIAEVNVNNSGARLNIDLNISNAVGSTTSINIDSSRVFLSKSSAATSNNSYQYIYNDSIHLYQKYGEYYIHNMDTAADMTGKLVMVRNSSTNKWEVIAASSLGIGAGTVTSVGFTGGLISVANPTTTPAFTVAGTSGGGVYFSSASTWNTTGVLVANALMIGGGAGSAYSTTTTGTGVLTFLGTPSSANFLAVLTDETGSGVAVFGTSPTFTTSVIGGASMDIFNTVTTTANLLKAATTVNMMGSAGVLNFGGGASAAELRFLEPSAGGTNYTGFKAAAMTVNTIYTLPAAFPSGTYLLQSNNLGGMSFLDPATLIFTLSSGSATTAAGSAVNWGGTATAAVNVDMSTNPLSIINSNGTTLVTDIDLVTTSLGNTATNRALIVLDEDDRTTTIYGENNTVLTSANIQFSAFGAGAITADASGILSSVSDIRLKNVQGSYQGGLKELMNITPIIYKWNVQSGMEMQHNYIGFSAQNIKESLGEGSYGINKNGYYSIQDRAILATLVRAVQEQQKEIETLKQQFKNK